MDTTPKHLLKERLLLLERKAAGLPPHSVPWWRSHGAVVGAAATAVVVASTAERLAFKAMVDAMPPYRYFLAQLISALHLPLLAGLAWWRVREKAIDEEMTEVPKRKFALMGFLDMLSCMLLTVSAGEVRAPLTVLLLQAQLPLQTLLTRTVLRVRYRPAHIAGALLVLVGIFVNMGPSFQAMVSGNWEHLRSGSNAPTASGKMEATLNPWFTLAYLLAAVPAALSAVYKESCLRKTPIDQCYLNAWVSLFQFVLGLFAAPIVLKDSFGMGQLIAGVGGCFSGGGGEGYQCEKSAPWLVGAFLLASLALHRALNFLLLRNATAVYVATSVAVATAYLALELYAQTRGEVAFALYDTLALLAAMAGFVAVRWMPEPDITVVTELIPERQVPTFQ